MAHAQQSAATGAPRNFVLHLATMPFWHKLVLMAGLIMAIGGGVGWVMTRTDQAPRTNTTTTVRTPANASSFAQGGGAESSTVTSTSSTEDGLLSKISPNTTRIGASVIVGFVLGWIFRAFLKLAIFFAALGVGAMLALSYFGILNIDFTAAREHYATAVHWLTDQSYRLKDLIIAHLPSSTGGAFGAFLGFRRK
jgi:uncharacterized membrane protein (Fun14 family)